MSWLSVHAAPLIDCVVYSTVGILILLGAFWLAQRILPFSLRKEIEEDHNVSLGIILGAFVIGIAIIIAAVVG
jgi:putative membrane protein